MQNFPVTIKNKEYWISRSVATAAFIFTLDDGLKVLANKRGAGCPDYQGFWNCPCGYLDYNETLVEGCSREIVEETNLSINPKKLSFYNVDDTPEGKQNITFNFWSFDSDYKNENIYAKGSEKDEVAEVAWIGIDELDDYLWAFNHKYLIRSIALDYLRKYLTKEQRKRLQAMTNSST